MYYLLHDSEDDLDTCTVYIYMYMWYMHVIWLNEKLYADDVLNKDLFSTLSWLLSSFVPNSCAFRQRQLSFMLAEVSIYF